MDVPEPIAAVQEATVVFVINRAWSPSSDDRATYDATRKYWKVGARTRDRATYALGVAGGIVRGAYRIQEWHQSGDKSRWGFVGVPAPELRAVGTSIERLAPPRGAANPVRLYLDGIPASDTTTVRVIARELNAEPLARIMYGQRELFHSNFLAWFFDSLPKSADAVFRNLAHDDPQNTVSVRHSEREREQLDLVFHWPDASPLVIENKVFSLPQRDQLDAYRKKTARWKASKVSHVLLSMSPLQDLPEDWTYLSYQELSERIELALEDSLHESYEVETLRRYSRVVRLLNALLDNTQVHSMQEPVWLDDAQFVEIESRQTRSALLKLRANRVKELLIDAIPRVGQAESGMTHSQPFVGWRRRINLNGIQIEAGWQYQGGQFRLCVVLPHLESHSEQARALREKFAHKHPELFSFEHLFEILNVSADQIRPDHRFGHFAPSFVYRYVKAPELTVSQLVEASQSTAYELQRLFDIAPDT
ncbi:PD-(D/E)XK nuclease family protein [Flaviflexus equikiangi]|uniref:PD-(D/E)XK nuclease family protein n=1 Tax=Flaviflexus equikiangi TaxID=2758573 RepID=A0ABS2TEL0_9ACTO|nr:PD-(D/E)XK nuclease family protein [Flaviflexus equikiangi]MBM9433089.1 PD-(D/E)XK nuclease family protein [Flaviflexus equikiangi]